MGGLPLKRTCIFITILCLFLTSFPLNVNAQLSVSARNAVLMEQETGRVLLEKQAHEKRNIASITKIMTAIVAIESGELNEKATASRKAVYTEGSSIYLEQGEKMKLKDLVYGLMLRSGNDSAVAIAEKVGGSVEGFAHLMNKKAEWIGMTNSNFANPHGLDAEGHYSTAYDMALLMRYAMQNDTFRKISGTTTYKADSRVYAWGNKNKMLTKYYEYCTGGKTGYTKTAGRTLVTTAEKDGMELIMVTLDGPDDWNDHRNAFNWGFENYNMEEIRKEGKYDIDSSQQEETLGYIWKDVRLPLTNEEVNQINEMVITTDSTGTEPTSILAKAVYTLNGKPLKEVSIMASPESEDQSYFNELIRVLKGITGVF